MIIATEQLWNKFVKGSLLKAGLFLGVASISASCSKTEDANFAILCSGKGLYGTPYNLTIISTGGLGERLALIDGTSYYSRELSVRNDDTGNWLTIRQFASASFDHQGKAAAISIPSTIATMPRPGTKFSDSNEGLTSPIVINRNTGSFAVDLYTDPKNSCEKIDYFEPPPAVRVAIAPKVENKQKF